jgi:hypothetical protein
MLEFGPEDRTMASKKMAIRNNQLDSTRAKYPRHSVEKALRIPRAILDQNAGKDCSSKQAAAFLNVGPGGPFAVEIGSAKKYGFLEPPKKEWFDSRT